MTSCERDQYVTITNSYDQFESSRRLRWRILKPEFPIGTPRIPDSQVCRQKALRSRLIGLVQSEDGEIMISKRGVKRPLEKQVTDQEPRTCPQIWRPSAARGPGRGLRRV